MKELPELPEYLALEDYLEIERDTLVKNGAFSDDDDFVRSLEDAKLILANLKLIQTALMDGFEKYPSLVGLFKDEFTSFTLFVSREYISEICFMDDCLFPDKELFDFTEDGEISVTRLSDLSYYFTDWIKEKVQKHEETQTLVKEKFDLEIRMKNLACHCKSCSADYRTKVREQIFNECSEFIEETKQDIEENIDAGIWTLSEYYYGLQKRLDGKFKQVRSRLKRATLNKLETQVKNIVRKNFTYPAPVAKLHIEKNLKPFFVAHMRSEMLNPALIVDREYERFFKQISTNLWRNERYLEREFKKLIKSVLLLKRKDISGKILTDYLGEFWIHSEARKLNRKIIYHMGPTNSGKTYHAIESLCEAKSGCYLAPLRLLAGELYDTMNNKGVKTTLLTGEEVIEVDDSTHYSSTIEMARFHEVFDCCVIDEIQMITDSQRGWAWTRALVNIYASEVHICGDASALDLVKEIVELCGDTLEIKNYERMTELVVEKKPTVLGDLKKSDAVIVFSRRKALKYKNDLEKLGFKVSIVYGRLSPEVRREQARKFDEGETDIIVSTDAIAMGMNLPIHRIVFTTLSKFINSQESKISESEIKQIAGRAGRYKRFPIGYVNCLKRVEDGIDRVNESLACVLPQKTECMVGPDLDIFAQVNGALRTNSLPELRLSEFLRLFNTMTFKEPFYCVELKEMIEIAEMVEEADQRGNLTNAEIFGFACAPVNLGMMEHVEYFVWILNRYANAQPIFNEPIDEESTDIDYLETKIKCVELFQWLSRHFNNKHFDYDEFSLLDNKGRAIAKLNDLLSEKILPTCSSCGGPLEESSRFAICENCFKNRRFASKRRGGHSRTSDDKKRRGGEKRAGKKRPSGSFRSSSSKSSGGAKSKSKTRSKSRAKSSTKAK